MEPRGLHRPPGSMAWGGGGGSDPPPPEHFSSESRPPPQSLVLLTTGDNRFWQQCNSWFINLILALDSMSWEHAWYVQPEWHMHPKITRVCYSRSKATYSKPPNWHAGSRDAKDLHQDPANQSESFSFNLNAFVVGGWELDIHVPIIWWVPNSCDPPIPGVDEPKNRLNTRQLRMFINRTKSTITSLL